MESERIKDFDALIKKFKGDNIEIVEKKFSNLTAPGENYWSDILQLDLTIRNKITGSENVEHLVVKCVVTATDDFMGLVGANLFKTEIRFYADIIPTIQTFLQDHGLPKTTIFPEMIAARLSLGDSGDADENAILVLENLKKKGFINVDRHKGFDLDGAKLVLADLAAYHAIPLAIKLLNPQLFDEKIRKNCVLELPKPPSGESHKPPPFPFDLLKQIIKGNQFGRKHFKKFEDIVKKEEENMKNNNFFMKKKSTNPFDTLTHNDMWVNNTMQVVNEDGKLIRNILVDFQMYSIGIPTNDLIFFILTSVDLQTLENHFDYLLMYYHEQFIKILESLKCDTTPFRYSKFMELIKEAFLEKFLHAGIMNMTVIFAKKGEKTDFNKNNELKPSDIHPTAKGIFIFLFKQLVEKDWI